MDTLKHGDRILYNGVLCVVCSDEEWWAPWCIGFLVKEEAFIDLNEDKGGA